MSRTALIVEDDPDIVELVSHYLTREGWRVDAVSDGREALTRARQGGYRLALLDIQVPGLDGLSLCTELRRLPGTRQIAIVMLTARAEESDRIVGLELGADDYVVKPFSPKELMARVRALFRRIDERADPGAGLHLRLDDLELDLERRTARWAGEAVHLTAKEFGLLQALLRAQGRVLTRAALLEQVWGYSYAEGTRTVDVHVRRLRSKLPGLAERIVTVKSLGYRIVTDDRQEDR